MWKVVKDKIRNVQIDENNTKNFYEGEILPEGYEPPISYIENGIVGKIDNEIIIDKKKRG